MLKLMLVTQCSPWLRRAEDETWLIALSSTNVKIKAILIFENDLLNPSSIYLPTVLSWVDTSGCQTALCLSWLLSCYLNFLSLPVEFFWCTSVHKSLPMPCWILVKWGHELNQYLFEPVKGHLTQHIYWFFRWMWLQWDIIVIIRKKLWKQTRWHFIVVQCSSVYTSGQWTISIVL